MHIVISSLAMLLPISLIYQIKAIMSLLENGSLNTKIEIFFLIAIHIANGNLNIFQSKSCSNFCDFDTNFDTIILEHLNCTLLNRTTYLHVYKINFMLNCWNLFQISDDDRMSLTTAVSDEDEGESVMNSPYKAKQTGTAAASFNCTGAVRKAG